MKTQAYPLYIHDSSFIYPGQFWDIYVLIHIQVILMFFVCNLW